MKHRDTNDSKPNMCVPASSASNKSEEYDAGGLLLCAFFFFAGELSQYADVCSTYCNERERTTQILQHTLTNKKWTLIWLS